MSSRTRADHILKNLSDRSSIFKDSFPKVVHIWDQKLFGRYEYGLYHDSWNTRDLNEIDNDSFSDITLNNNQFTLPIKHSYTITINSLFFNCEWGQIRLFDVTDNKAIKYGTDAYSSNPSSSESTIMLNLILGDDCKTYEIQYQSKPRPGQLDMYLDKPNITTQVKIEVTDRYNPPFTVHNNDRYNPEATYPLVDDNPPFTT